MDFNLDELLIEEVRKHHLLYDLGHDDYKDLKKKEWAWKDISRKLKVNAIQCKSRWKGLRISYMRCKRTDNVPKKTSSGFPKPKWRFCKNMSFLDHVKKSRPTDSTRTFQDVWLEVCDSLDPNDQQYLTDIDAVESLAPAFQTAETHEENNRARNFENSLHQATSSTPKTIAALKPNSTELLFDSLATKIREANLPMSISTKINAKVVALVFSEIQAYQNYVEEANQ